VTIRYRTNNKTKKVRKRRHRAILKPLLSLLEYFIDRNVLGDNLPCIQRVLKNPLQFFFFFILTNKVELGYKVMKRTVLCRYKQVLL